MANTIPRGELPPRYISQSDAAAILGVSIRTVRNMIAEGKLPAYRLGGRNRVRIKLSDVESVLTRVPAGGAA